MSKLRYAALCLIAIIFLFSVFIFADKTQKVSVIEIEQTRANRTIACSGKIESKNTTPVEFQFPAVFRSVNYKTGENVKKGEIIAVIDRKKTLDFISGLIQSYASLPSFSDITLPIESIASLLPENIIAPASGIITGSSIDGDKYTNLQMPVFTISDDSELMVRIPVGETQIASIKEGQYAVISGQGFTGKEYGKVTEISSSARDNFSLTDNSTVVDVFVSIPNDNSALRPGLSTSTKILTSVNDKAVIIPYDIIMQDDDNNEYVFVADGNTAKKRIIKTGAEYENGTEVLHGLSVGEKVISSVENIKDGTKIKIG